MTQVFQDLWEQVDAGWQPWMAEIHGVSLVRAAPLGHLRQASENPPATAVSARKLREKWRCPADSHEIP